MLASATIDTMELRESMLDSGISKAISAVLSSYSTPSTSAAGRQLLSAALDILSALLRPAPASGEDMAAATAELKPLLKRVKPAALDAACTALAAAQHGKEGRGVRRAALTLLAQLAQFQACHPEILEGISLTAAIAQALTGTLPSLRYLIYHSATSAESCHSRTLQPRSARPHSYPR